MKECFVLFSNNADSALTFNLDRNKIKYKVVYIFVGFVFVRTNEPFIVSFILGILVGFAYFYSISHHFHTITNFSSLTSLEKELSLPAQSVSNSLWG